MGVRIVFVFVFTCLIRNLLWAGDVIQGNFAKKTPGTCASLTTPNRSIENELSIFKDVGVRREGEALPEALLNPQILRSDFPTVTFDGPVSDRSESPTPALSHLVIQRTDRAEAYIYNNNVFHVSWSWGSLRESFVIDAIENRPRVSLSVLVHPRQISKEVPLSYFEVYTDNWEYKVDTGELVLRRVSQVYAINFDQHMAYRNHYYSSLRRNWSSWEDLPLSLKQDFLISSHFIKSENRIYTFSLADHDRLNMDISVQVSPQISFQSSKIENESDRTLANGVDGLKGLPQYSNEIWDYPAGLWPESQHNSHLGSKYRIHSVVFPYVGSGHRVVEWEPNPTLAVDWADLGE